LNDLSAYNEQDELRVLESLVVLARHKRAVLGVPLAAMLLAGVIALLLPNLYTGAARVLPPQQGGASPLAAILLDSVAGGGGSGNLVSSALGLKNPADLYVGMLQSQTVSDAIIRRFGLQALYDKETLVETRKRLERMATLTAGKEGIITIEVDDEDPKRAAEMANAFVDELDKLTQTVAVTAAGRQRMFLEKQLAQTREQLAQAEVSLRTTQERTGLISVAEQGKATIESAVSLRALVAAKEVQLGAMRAGITEYNPDYVRAHNELQSLRGELSKVERSNPRDPVGVVPAAGRIPGAGLEYMRKARDVQYYQTLFELLAKQYELAKAQEAGEAGPIQVLDRASPPDKKSRPYRLLIVALAGLLAGLAGIVIAFILEGRDRAERDPVQSVLLEELRRHGRELSRRATA
jgi:tyrosine-protein kinase Etk/Wzc